MSLERIPIPSPGWSPGLAQANALVQSALQNRIAQSEAQYAPWTNYANAASKIAYSNFVGPQAIASILNNPATRGMFTKDQYNALAKAFAGQVAGSGNALANLPAPPTGMPFGGVGGIAAPWLNKLWSTISAPQNQSAAMQPTQPSNALLQQPQISQSPSLDSSGNNPLATQQEIDAKVNNILQNPLPEPTSSYAPPSSQIDRTAKLVQPQGTMGGYSPQAVQEAQEAQLKTQATTEAAEQRRQWTEIHQLDNKLAQGAYDTNLLADKFSSYYDQLSPLERGPIQGRGPAITDAAQGADLATKQMADAIARAQQMGHITQADRATYGSMKFGRFMNPGAKDDAIRFINGVTHRQQEHQAFNLAADKAGLTPQEANTQWNKYINDKPFINHKTHKLNEKNFDQWGKYINPNVNKPTSKSSSSGKVLVREKRTGVQGYIPEDRLEAYESNGYERV